MAGAVTRGLGVWGSRHHLANAYDVETGARSIYRDGAQVGAKDISGYTPLRAGDEVEFSA